MPSLPSLPQWLRRGLEAGAVTGLIAAVALAASGFGPGGEPRLLPAGFAGILALAPGILAMGVVAVAYPIAFAATRGDAILGAVAAVLVAADLAIVIASGRVLLLEQSLPAGLLTAGLAVGPAVAGVAASQATGLGFGRRPGAWAAIAASLVSLIVVAAVGVFR